MTDAARTPQRRPVGQAGAPIQIAGINGIGQLPQVELPVAPTVQIEDRTQDFLARSQQSVQNAFDLQQQAIESTARADVAEAQARGRNNFASNFSGVVSAIQSGMQMYQEVQAGRREQESQQLAAQFENELRQRVVQLHRDVGQNASDEGLIPTYTAMLRQLRQQYAGRLDPQTLQTISNIGWDAITEVQREQGARWVNELEDTQAQGRELRLNELRLQIAPLINQLTHGSISVDPNAVTDQINQQLGSYLSQHDMSGIDALTTLNGIYPFVISAYETAGADATRLTAQQGIITSVLQEAATINSQLSGNKESRDAAFAQLQLLLNNAGIQGVTLTDIFQTDVQRLQQNTTIQNNLDSLRRASLANPRQSPEYQRATDIQNRAIALNWFNNPSQSAREIEAASGADATLDQRTQLRIYNGIQEGRSRIRELEDQNGQLLQTQYESLAEIETIARKLDPTGELGPPTIAIDYIRRLVELNTDNAVERGAISATEANRLQELERSVFTDAQRQIDANTREIGNINSDFLSIGINMVNPADTTQIDRQLAEIEPILQDALQQSDALSPPNFQLGLPPLPRR